MESASVKQRFPLLYGLPFALAFGLTVLMLATDKNLQTNFGTMASGYYLHWWGVLVTAIADLVALGLLVLLRTRTSVKIGVIGSGLLVVVFLGVILSYSQVGFSSAMAFAQYLFGVTYYGGDLRYLYDVLLAVYIATFATGVAGLVLTKDVRAAETPNGTGKASSS